MSPDPDFTAIRPDISNTVERLHGRMGKVRNVILCLNFFNCSFQGRCHITSLSCHKSRFCSHFFILLQLFDAVEICKRAMVPVNFKSIPTAIGSPERIGNDSHTAVNLHHRFDTGNFFCCRIVNAFDLPAKYRWSGNHCCKHARHHHINTKNCLAICFVRGVQAFFCCTEHLEILRLFQDNILRHFHLAGFFGKLAKGKPTLAARVNDVAVISPTSPRGNIPRCSSSSFQHDSCRRSCRTQLFPCRPDAGAAAGALNPPLGMIICRINRCRFYADFLPVKLQLFGNEHGKRGVNALPHFRLIDNDGYTIIGADTDKSIGRKRLDIVERHRFGFAFRKIDAKDQPATN